MLELYHWEPSVDSGEPLICLREKDLAYTAHYVDVLDLQQHAAAFLRLNPQGQVPVLVHEGRVLTETGLILQYLEDAFPQVPLLPAAQPARYQALFWLKYVEERMAPAVTLLGWHEITRPRLPRELLERAERTLELLPPERRGWWNKALRDSYATEDLTLVREVLTLAAGKLEHALSGAPWLAGESYSLADIALVFVVRAMRSVTPEIVNRASTPRTVAWLERLEQRPAVQETLASARSAQPERLFAPGPELARWG
jgi:GST-like protein